MSQMTEIIISLLLFGGIVLSVTGFQSSVFSNYGTSYIDLSYVNKSNQLISNVNEIRSSFNSSDFTSVIGNVPKSIIRITLLVPNVLDVVAGVANDFTSILGIESYWAVIAIAVVTIIIFFGIIYLLSGREL